MALYAEIFSVKCLVIINQGSGLLPQKSVHVGKPFFQLVPPEIFELSLLLFFP